MCQREDWDLGLSHSWLIDVHIWWPYFHLSYPVCFPIFFLSTSLLTPSMTEMGYPQCQKTLSCTSSHFADSWILMNILDLLPCPRCTSLKAKHPTDVGRNARQHFQKEKSSITVLQSVGDCRKTDQHRAARLMHVLLLESQLPFPPQTVQQFFVSLHREAELPPSADISLFCSSRTLFPHALLWLLVPGTSQPVTGCPSHLLTCG